jgi:cell division protein FtsA
MQEHSRYSVGIDVGTYKTRCVVAHLDGENLPKIIGVGEALTSGMRKGTVVSLDGPAKAIDEALGEAERMSGYQVNEATISINGNNILSTHTSGMIAVGSADHFITSEDLIRIEEVATLGKIPANREILDVVPHSYILDGQNNIKNPLGMNGSRLELDANVISILAPDLHNLTKAADAAKVHPKNIVVSGIAAARAVLSDAQKENGVALIDIGGSTTNIAIYEEGDLRFVSVLSVGGSNITNDLAIGLKTDPEVAEKVKLMHGSALIRREHTGVSIKHEGGIENFDSREIDEIIEARLEEIFNAILKEFKRAGMFGKLPSGVVITGGTARLPHIAEFAKEHLGVAAKVAEIKGFTGVVDGLEKPEYATVIGLMLTDTEGQLSSANPKQKKSLGTGSFSVGKFLKKFKV